MIRDGAIQAAAAAVTSGWRDGPQITVVETAADLALELPHDVEAIYRDGKVTLIANALHPARAVEVLAHEAVGHHGLRAVLGGAWASFMAAVAAGSSRDPLLRAARAHVERVYIDEAGSCELTGRQLADEVAAAVAERRMDLMTLGLAVDAPLRKQALAVHGYLAREVLLLDVPACAAQVEGALLLAERRVRHGPLFFGWLVRARDWYAGVMAPKPYDFSKPPMSLQQSEDLLRGAKDRENFIEDMKGTGIVFGGLACLVALIACIVMGWYWLIGDIGAIFMGR